MPDTVTDTAIDEMSGDALRAALKAHGIDAPEVADAPTMRAMLRAAIDQERPFTEPSQQDGSTVETGGYLVPDAPPPAPVGDSHSAAREYYSEPGGSTAAIVPAGAAVPALVEPVADLEHIAEAYEKYEALVDRLLTDADYQVFRSRGEERRFVKKSGWRKLSIAMGVDLTVVAKEVERDDDGRTVRATITARATAPNGRTVDGLGVCSLFEQRFGGDPADRTDHDVLATAETRAKNRAASDLFGFGAVSAEEMQGGGGYGGDYEHEGEYGEPVQHRRTTRSTSSGNATEGQVKMMRARLAEAKEQHGIDRMTPVLPLGWQAKGLPTNAAAIKKGQVDDALALIATAARDGQWEPIDEPEAQ